MHLPWNKDMDGMLKERLGGDFPKFLPALWTDMDDTAVAGGSVTAIWIRLRP